MLLALGAFLLACGFFRLLAAGLFLPGLLHRLLLLALGCFRLLAAGLFGGLRVHLLLPLGVALRTLLFCGLFAGVGAGFAFSASCSSQAS